MEKLATSRQLQVVMAQKSLSLRPILQHSPEKSRFYKEHKCFYAINFITLYSDEGLNSKEFLGF